MLETSLALGMFAAILGLISVILKILLSMETKITRNSMKISYIQQSLGLGNCGCDEDKKKGGR
jgi:hypothetical protein